MVVIGISGLSTSHLFTILRLPLRCSQVQLGFTSVIHRVDCHEAHEVNFVIYPSVGDDPG